MSVFTQKLSEKSRILFQDVILSRVAARNLGYSRSILAEKGDSSFPVITQNDMQDSFKTLSNKVKNPEKGQSFVELLLVTIFLMIFVLAIAEYGTLLNHYLNLVDATREAARVASDFAPADYCEDTDGSGTACDSEGELVQASEDYFNVTIGLAQVVMKPIVLDETRGDDIVISYFVIGSDVNDLFDRYPAGSGGYTLYGTQTSKFSEEDIRNRLIDTGPSRGILLVEIFYNYPQRLKVPVFTAIVPDPIPVYSYAIMPMPKVKP